MQPPTHQRQPCQGRATVVLRHYHAQAGGGMVDIGVEFPTSARLTRVAHGWELSTPPFSAVLSNSFARELAREILKENENP